MTTGRPGLPHWRELTTVFRTSVRPPDSALLKQARMLASAHRVRAVHPGCDAAFEAGRAALRGWIAEWIIGHTGARPTAAAACAVVIDDMAAAHVTAERLLQIEPPPSAEQLHAAWFDVGYLATYWTELVAEVIDGQPPVPWPLKRR
ncbi:hypothetical protein [Nocardia asteroides]|uniref:hypothetical protein n=1 Tax=Nocardia asteroides TaxID=1824 RepID=UPI001E43E095|nr:hypothetical protein [Nocardia asteroides]UGT59770.1 hypothetical protein LTT61_21395 [Nocardia asteroides]